VSDGKYWIKLWCDFFHDPKMFRFTNDQRYVVIALFGFAKKSPREGFLEVAKNVPASREELTGWCNTDSDTLAQTINGLVTLKVLEQQGDTLFFPQWVKRQYSGSYLRVMRHRHRRNVTGTKPCNEKVTHTVEEEEDKEEEKEKEKPIKRCGRFAPPTVEEVMAYCRERNNQIDPELFVDRNTACGWRVGKNPMKDWKAAIRTWEKNEYNRPKQTDNKPKPCEVEGCQYPGKNSRFGKNYCNVHEPR
jgi:hypothetical protein